MKDIVTEEQNSSRKKFMIPLVALLLCAVSLTGAAYAYDSTLTNSGNSIEAGMLSIDLQSGSAASDITLGTSDVIVYTDNFKYSKSGGNWVKTNQVKYSLNSVDIVTYKVKITRESGNSGTVDIKMDLTGLKAIKITLNGEEKNLTEIFDVKYKLDSGTATALTVDSGTDSAAATVNGQAVGDHTVVFSFALKSGIDATGNVTSAPVASNDSGYKTAAVLQSAFAGGSFGVSFTATGA